VLTKRRLLSWRAVTIEPVKGAPHQSVNVYSYGREVPAPVAGLHRDMFGWTTSAGPTVLLMPGVRAAPQHWWQLAVDDSDAVSSVVEARISAAITFDIVVMGPISGQTDTSFDTVFVGPRGQALRVLGVDDEQFTELLAQSEHLAEGLASVHDFKPLLDCGGLGVFLDNVLREDTSSVSGLDARVAESSFSQSAVGSGAEPSSATPVLRPSVPDPSVPDPSVPGPSVPDPGLPAAAPFSGAKKSGLLADVLGWSTVAVVCAVFVLFPAWLSVGAAKEWRNHGLLNGRESVVATADLLEISSSSSLKTWTTSSATYRYSVDGKTFTKTREVDSSLVALLQGRKVVPVRYLSTSPKRSDLAGNDLRAERLTVALLLDAALLGLVLVVRRVARRS
jgi:hypothetical protein